VPPIDTGTPVKVKTLHHGRLFLCRVKTFLDKPKGLQYLFKRGHHLGHIQGASGVNATVMRMLEYI
jgi:hypothetical protein